MKTARDETGKQVTTKKVETKAEEKEENRNNTKQVVGEAGDAKEGGRISEGAMDVQECDISDQNATPTDRVEWVSGFDCGQARALGAGAVPPGTYCQTPQCHLVKRPRPRGLPD